MNSSVLRGLYGEHHGQEFLDVVGVLARSARKRRRAVDFAYGVSSGGDAGVILTALERRLKTSVLQGTGIWRPWAPEIDLLNYAPRVRMPTLMLNGRYAFGEPLETAQRPLFNLLGTPTEHKRHVVFETGHALPMDDVAREILPWLDRYLGEVVR